MKIQKFIVPMFALAVVSSSFASSHAAPKPGDAQIQKVVSTVNDGEIKLANYMLEHSNNAKVKEFAQHMVSDHGMNNKMMSELSTKIRMKP